MSKTTPLYEYHCAHGATMVEFAGWKMPLHYGSQVQEHHQVRNDAGVFDVSHMLAIDIEGKCAREFLRKILANDIAKLNNIGKALYSCMLNEKGGVLDDLIVYYIKENHFRLVVNAGTAMKDVAWLEGHAKAYRENSVSILPRRDLGILAIQGPKAWEKVRQVFDSVQNTATQGLKPFQGIQVKEWFIAYTGYTGEAGLEVILPQTAIKDFWERLLQHDIAPIGLGARDTLRLEAGFNLYGQDMDETVTPLESNLAWTVDWKDPQRDFLGKSALEQQKATGIMQELRGLVLVETGICRKDMQVWGQTAEHEKILCGKITSGGYSPTLGKSIGLARIKKGNFSKLRVTIREKSIALQWVKPPFISHGKPSIDLKEKL